MAAELGEAFVRIRPDTDGFGRELGQDLDRETKRATLGLGDAISVGAVVGGFAKITDAASQLEQAVGGTEAVFKDASGAIDEFAEGAAKSAGLSERAARELTSTLGGLLKGFGFTQDEAAATSIELAQLGADLSALSGGSPEQAVQALGAALRGETDPLENYGIALNQTVINAKAVELGLAESTSKVDQQAKAQATLALITERSADAQGQFFRESESAAGAAAIAAAEAENASASIGENFLPIYTKLAEAVGFTANAFGSLPGSIQTAVVVLGAAAALAGPMTRGYNQAADAIQGLRTRFDQATPRARGMATALTGVAGAAAGIAAVVTAVDALADKLNEGRFGTAINDAGRLGDSLAELAEGRITGALREDLDGIGEAFFALRDQADDADSSLEGLLGRIPAFDRGADAVEGWVAGTSEAAQQLDTLDKALADLIRTSPEAGRAAFETLRQTLLGAGVTVEELNAAFDDTAGVLRDVESGTLGAAEGIESIGGASKTSAQQLAEIGKEASDSLAAVQRLERALTGQRDAELGLEDAQLGVRDAQLDLQDAQQGVTDAVAEYGPNSREAAEAVLRREQAEIALERAQIDVLGAQRELNAATKEQADTLRDSSVPQLVSYRDQLTGLQGQAGLTAGALALITAELREIDRQLVLLASRDALGSVNTLGRNLAISIRAGRGEYGLPTARPGG